MSIFFFFFNDTATTEIYTLSLHDALPICGRRARTEAVWLSRRDRGPTRVRQRTRAGRDDRAADRAAAGTSSLTNAGRSEEHTSELQSPCNLVCRLLLEKKTKMIFFSRIYK